MFINLSNYKSTRWSKQQLTEARKLGKCKKITNIAFPSVNPNADKREVYVQAESIANFLLKYKKEQEEKYPVPILIQGEQSLTVALVGLLKITHEFVPYVTCKKRNGKKPEFVQFREL